jgi:nitroreductase
MFMDVEEAIRKRRSVRKYLDKEVEREKLLKVLDAGRLAPSANNSQSWDFVVVQNKETRGKIAQGTVFARFLDQAPVVVVGVGNPKSRYHVTDVSIALENMALQATELGLGSCWVGDFREERVKKLLGIPKGLKIVCLLALGYQRFERTAKEEVLRKISRTIVKRGRKPLEEIVHWDNF